MPPALAEPDANPGASYPGRPIALVAPAGARETASVDTVWPPEPPTGVLSVVPPEVTSAAVTAPTSATAATIEPIIARLLPLDRLLERFFVVAMSSPYEPMPIIGPPNSS